MNLVRPDLDRSVAAIDHLRWCDDAFFESRGGGDDLERGAGLIDLLDVAIAPGHRGVIAEMIRIEGGQRRHEHFRRAVDAQQSVEKLQFEALDRVDEHRTRHCVQLFPADAQIQLIPFDEPRHHSPDIIAYGQMPKRTDIHSILIIGSGPIVIGQAVEFDYSGTQACKALRDEGYRIILVNSNPATIMTVVTTRSLFNLPSRFSRCAHR